MDQQSLPTSPNPTVTLTVNGELMLKGWDENEIVARSSSSADLILEQRDDQVAIVCRGDCSVKVPLEAQVRVESVDGNASLKSLEGSLKIENVKGNLLLRGVSETVIKAVSGNLTARNIAGDLRIEVVHGNATLRDVAGDLTVEDAVNGNLNLDDLGGDGIAEVNGNINLRLDPSPGNRYKFNAGGNILCRIPEDASVEVKIDRASRIAIRAPGVKTPSPTTAPYTLTLGDADAELYLAAGGDLLLNALPFNWEMEDLDIGEDLESMAESIGEQVAQQVEAHMEILEQQLESQLENLSRIFKTTGVSSEHAERMASRAREATERANARAQEKLRRAQEKLQRKLEVARRRAEMKARAAERKARDRRRRPETFQWAAPPPKPPDEPVSDEERMMILQMLEQQKITIEEAEQLLAALEGRQK